MQPISKSRLAGVVTVALLSLTVARADAATLRYTAVLSGANEAPPVVSPALGLAKIAYDDVLHEMTLAVSFSGLSAGATAAHIHGPVISPATSAGIITPAALPGFPFGASAGLYTTSFFTNVVASYSGTFLSASGGTAASAESLFLSALAGGMTYFNVHTSVHPSGEIRGTFIEDLPGVPLPATLPLLSGALVLAGSLIRKSKRGQRRPRHD